MFLLESIEKEVRMIVDFASAAFPWVAMGIAIAVILTHLNSKQKLKS